MNVFLRKVRVALTPRHWLLRTRLACGATVCGQNRAGYGGRYIYIFGESIEPEFEHLEKFLVPGGVMVDGRRQYGHLHGQGRAIFPPARRGQGGHL